MADSKIVITAGLDIPDSVNTISKDLYQVRDKLDSDRALKIVCNVDISKTTKRIQSQLDTLSKNLIIKIPEIKFGNSDKSFGGTEFTPKIKPEIDKKSTAKQVKELEKLLDLQFARGSTKEIRKEIASLLTEYKNALNSRPPRKLMHTVCQIFCHMTALSSSPYDSMLSSSALPYDKIFSHTVVP